MKVQTSEYCAVGHPDRTCDFIVAYILDRYLRQDRNARVALEAQLKEQMREQMKKGENPDAVPEGVPAPVQPLNV